MSWEGDTGRDRNPCRGTKKRHKRQFEILLWRNSLFPAETNHKPVNIFQSCMSNVYVPDSSAYIFFIWDNRWEMEESEITSSIHCPHFPVSSKWVKPQGKHEKRGSKNKDRCEKVKFFSISTNPLHPAGPVKIEAQRLGWRWYGLRWRVGASPCSQSLQHQHPNFLLWSRVERSTGQI